MDLSQYALSHGVRQTRGALLRWNHDPWRVLGTWVAVAAGVAAGLLAVIWLVASRAVPDLTPMAIPGITEAPQATDVLQILFRNSLVLALHAFACVAGFIAGSSLPLSADRRTGFSRLVHEKARPIAFGWVIAVTCFSLATQAYALGSTGATLAFQLGISPAMLVLTALPHALPELTALFLPLAAWTLASRRGEWDDLLAATVVTVAIAVPVLVCTALWETYVWPVLLRAAAG
ncbi:MAG: hypothetical protein ACRDK1_00710 [Solirubrobacterales bacterium]